MCCGGPLDRLLTDAQIARRLGLTRDEVREVAAKPGFPEPVGYVGSAPLWPWTRVQAWMADPRQIAA